MPNHPQPALHLDEAYNLLIRTSGDLKSSGEITDIAADRLRGLAEDHAREVAGVLAERRPA